ncbi:NADH-quinone oxidoreductase subunit NuoN [Auraticoccus monumenti]|uniref:NADH-quinone oxidoreductase subunit N n=1 Tax=Auraticoccus monumenti TaxID=675864 RepID=A0A1G6WXX9_9ACTN|nr:NADH-quinone oxidoreductase subunit NuoN [Auraticoccus monumenti]SDD69855.1 NADH-quinone oxidoreductase subunit N [Auraticoccus monumenti]
MEITAPTLEYLRLLPLILVFAGACLGVLVEAVVPRRLRWPVQVGLTLLTLVVALAVTVTGFRDADTGISAVGALAVDDPSYFAWMALLGLGLLSLLLFTERTLNGGVSAFAPQAAAVPGSADEELALRARTEHSEVYPLVLFSLFGMMLFASANDLLMLFVALEVLSLPLYLICTLARRRRLLSQEAGLKYFMLGALASAFFLYGVALLFGYSGSFTLADLDAAVTRGTGSDWMLLAGLAGVVVGLLFKIGAVPFHAWTPDVYTGAPTAVTAFMSACTKVAAVVALLRVLYVGLGGIRWDWQPLIAVVAVLTMAVGSLLAITQDDVKRMLAYSSVTHAGFMLTAVSGASLAGGPRQLSSVGSTLFYLVAYGVASIGAFAVVTLVRDRNGEASRLSDWAGLGRRHPWLAGAFSVFMLSFAGIPLTSGFIAKVSVFESAWSGGFPWLVVAGVVLSLLAAYFYLRVIVTLFFAEPTERPTQVRGAAGGGGPTPAASGTGTGGGGGATAMATTDVLQLGGERTAASVDPGAVGAGRASVATYGAVAVAVVVTIVFGLVPGPLLELAVQAGVFLR